jgi:hypothetical protein
VDRDMLTRWRHGRLGRKVDPVWLGVVLLSLGPVAVATNRGAIGWSLASAATMAAAALVMVQVRPSFRGFSFWRRDFLIPGLVYLIVGTGMGYGLVTQNANDAAARATLRLTGRSAPAEVTSVYEGPRGWAAHSAQVTFRTYDNVLHTTGIELRDSSDRDIAVGSHMVIVYDPAHPDLAIPASALWADPWGRSDWIWAAVVGASVALNAWGLSRRDASATRSRS